jgi:hypothetical protein
MRRPQQTLRQLQETHEAFHPPRFGASWAFLGPGPSPRMRSQRDARLLLTPGRLNHFV